MYRLNLIHRLIKDGAYPNCRTVAERLEVSARTVLRDIDCLRDYWHAPVDYDPRRRGFYLTNPDYALPPVNLTQGEVAALALGVTALAAYRGTGLESPLRSLMDKLPIILPDHISVDLDSLQRGVSFMVEPPRGDAERVAGHFAALQRAIEERRRVEMDYYSASRDARAVRRVDPYHLRNFEGVWYAAGYCHLRGEWRTFAIDRIESLAVLDERFDAAAGFSPDEYFGESWRLERGAGKRRVVLRFSPYQARWVRGRVWHPTQEVREDTDGSLVLTFTVSGLGEVKRWAMQYGAGVEVLEPPELRAAVAAEAREMAGVYRVIDEG